MYVCMYVCMYIFISCSYHYIHCISYTIMYILLLSDVLSSFLDTGKMVVIHTEYVHVYYTWYIKYSWYMSYRKCMRIVWAFLILMGQSLYLAWVGYVHSYMHILVMCILVWVWVYVFKYWSRYEAMLYVCVCNILILG